MAKAKKTKPKAKKPAAKKAAPKKAAAKKPAAKKAAPKKAAPTKAAAAPVADSPAERSAAILLKQYDAGEIDNAWDVIGDMHELDGQLSKTSPLRPAFDKMFGEIEDICRESTGG